MTISPLRPPLVEGAPGPPPLALPTGGTAELDERTNRLAWVFTRYSDGITRILAGRIPPVPLQIEIHPYHGSQPMGCNNGCVWVHAA